MKKAGSICHYIFKSLKSQLSPGLSTLDVNNMVHTWILKHYGTPEFLGYPHPAPHLLIPYPAAACISINEEALHGIPSAGRIIQNGDLVSVDIGVRYDGFVVDCCRTFEIGDVPENVKQLNYWCERVLERAVAMVKHGVRWNDIAGVMEDIAIREGFGIIRDFASHGVGAKLHEPPKLRNYRDPENESIVLHEGQTITIEPMLTLGSGEIVIAPDQWTIITKDRQVASHWEHTLMVRPGGCQVFC